MNEKDKEIVKRMILECELKRLEKKVRELIIWRNNPQNHEIKYKSKK